MVRIHLQVGAIPSPVEIATATFLIEKHFAPEITFLVASKIKGEHTPDIEANGLKWEIKCPIGNSSKTIKRAFKTAIRQSENIIFDLRYSKLPDIANVQKLEKEFRDIKQAKRLIIITKTKQILDFSK